MGTRNYIAVIATVSCANQTARQIADTSRPNGWQNFPMWMAWWRLCMPPAAAPRRTACLTVTCSARCSTWQTIPTWAGRSSSRWAARATEIQKDSVALLPIEPDPLQLGADDPGFGRDPRRPPAPGGGSRAAAPSCQRQPAYPSAHLGAGGCLAMRRQRWLVGRDRQPAGGAGGGHPGGQRWDGHPGGNARNIRRRAFVDPPRLRRRRWAAG